MKAVIGIDEVGRGPVAGPVAVGAFVIKAKASKPKKNGKDVPLRDSKKLTREQREIWYEHIKAWRKEGKCDFRVTMIPAKTIDEIGLSVCIKRALSRSLDALDCDPKTLVLLDGGLRAPKEFKNQRTIVKGDEKEQVIALASIVAKVERDRHMFRQAKKFPQYGFERHVGYGTREHYRMIRKYGLTGLHRRSFLKKLK